MNGKQHHASALADDTPGGIGSGMRVLIADDVRDSLMTLGILLRSEGFAVELVSGGASVPSAVREFRPDAVLLDLGMPDRSGYAVAHDLRKEYGSACPILIAVTGHTQDAHRRLAVATGFRRHVAKPYDPNALLSLLASLKLPEAWA